jgi:hypothetical protein
LIKEAKWKIRARGIRKKGKIVPESGLAGWAIPEDDFQEPNDRAVLRLPAKIANGQDQDQAGPRASAAYKY